jgi:hypothetical protein
MVMSQINLTTRYKIVITVLLGLGLASLSALLLNLGLPFGIFILPGAIPLSIVAKSEPSPFAVLLANAVAYSCLASLLWFSRFRFSQLVALRRAALVLTVPVVIVFGMACVPKFNPLWPRGISELSSTENELRADLPVGLDSDQARAVLVRKNVEFQEHIQSSKGVVSSAGGRDILAVGGDEVFVARINSRATRFPCWYEIHLVILFGQEKRLKERDVDSVRVCP